MAQVQFLPRRRYCVRLGELVALALLVAQTGAVMHQYVHLGASGESRGAPASSQSCPDCLAYAPVLAAAGGTSHSPAFARAQIGTLYRSEEHTSELQSQSNLVCRLLLEKKKNV